MRRNWLFFKDSDWLILVFVHSAKPTAELENLAMSPSLSSPGLSYDTKFVHIGWELRSSLVGDTIWGVQSEPACNQHVLDLVLCPGVIALCCAVLCFAVLAVLILNNVLVHTTASVVLLLLYTGTAFKKGP